MLKSPFFTRLSHW